MDSNGTRMSYECLTIDGSDGNDFRLVNHFLKKAKQATAGRTDCLFWVKQAGFPVGALWLRPIDDDYWLRSLYIEPGHRHKGLATRLLLHTMQCLGKRQVFAFARPELTSLYQGVGFQEVLSESLPQPLQQKLMQYQRHQPHLRCFRLNPIAE